MAKRAVKPKERRMVPIPDDLRDVMRETYELILEARRDDTIAIDFDDAIQIGGLCGGRVGKKPRRFQFDYTPPDDKDARWELALHPTEIEDIGDGRMTELLMYCCTSPNCRRKFREAEGVCFECDYEE